MEIRFAHGIGNSGLIRMEQTDKMNDYEKDVLDVGEFSGTDIKVSPSFYLHMALIACQKSMATDNVTERVYAYRMAVDHLESVAQAAKLLDADYTKALDDFKEEDDYKKEEKEHTKFFKLARYQYRLIAEKIFSNVLLTTPLKM